MKNKCNILVFILAFIFVSTYSDMIELTPDSLVSSLTLSIGEMLGDISNLYKKQRIEEEYNKLRSQGDREKFNNIIFSLESLTKELNINDGNAISIRKIKEYTMSLSQIIREESFYSKMKEISRQTSLFTNIDISVFNNRETLSNNIIHNINKRDNDFELKNLYYISESQINLNSNSLKSFVIDKDINYQDKLSFNEDSFFNTNFILNKNKLFSYSENLEKYKKLSDYINSIEDSFIKIPINDSIILPSTVSIDKNSSFKQNTFVIVNGMIDIVFIKDNTGHFFIYLVIDKENSDFFELEYTNKSKDSVIKPIDKKDILDENLSICYIIKENSTDFKNIVNNLLNNRLNFKNRPYSTNISSNLFKDGLINFILPEKFFQENRGFSSHVRTVDRINISNPYQKNNIKLKLKSLENNDNILIFHGNTNEQNTLSGVFAKNSGSNFNFFNEYTLIENIENKYNVSYMVVYSDDMFFEKEYSYLKELGDFITNDNISHNNISFPGISETGIRNCIIYFSITGELIINTIDETKYIKKFIDKNPKSRDLFEKLNIYLNKTIELNNIDDRTIKLVSILKNSTIRKIILNSLVYNKKSDVKLKSAIY
ncbi:MAG: hypothetical protein M0R46_01195 [Candidatus Muirbacterium halophilum]|nr:hypothetical protein [Candidatus Muirbacterium halophilum]